MSGTFSKGPVQFSGVVPSLAQVSDFGPPRSECGVGCLMPWNGKLYVLNYSSHTRRTGTGTGLRVIESDFSMTRHPKAVDGTYANRYIHWHTQQLVIGPHVIDKDHNVRTVEALIDVRVTGTATHLTDPKNLVYMLGMEGELFELNVHTLESRQLFDLRHELGAQTGSGYLNTHFKDCYSCFGRLVVVNNDYHEPDWNGTKQNGTLAEWDGKAWKVISRSPHVCVNGRNGFGGTMFAIGWDRSSALLQVFTDCDKTWRTYRLPKASHCFDHKWQTEWPRIREVEHERFLMDHHGMWYELSPWAYGGRIWGVRPVSTHLWVHGDFCSWQGMLVVGADNASSSDGLVTTTAEPQSGIWMGKTDDLWQYGKPTGWGGPWWDTQVKADEPSDPYLMTGFEHKCIHVSQKGGSSMNVRIEVDFKGCGEYHPYATLAVGPGGYAHHTFPTGFSAHWVRVVADADALATAQLTYS